MPAFHTVSYRGPLTTTLKLNFVVIPSVFEELFANESADIKHTKEAFQRNIVIDANVRKLSISFKVRKFVGPTDFCGYGGIRMFNHLNTTVSRHPTHNYLQAHVQYNTKQKSHSIYLRKASYLPICTNDSLIFERQFYLDFGKTYFVFYDFNSVWDIDVTLNVHPSKYQALYNYEETYCSDIIQTYVFNNFFILCKISLVRLTQQIPLILQWSLGSSTIFQKKVLKNFECVWQGRMDMIINQNYMNLVIFNSAKKICSPNSILFITGGSKTKTVILGKNTQNQRLLNVDSLEIKRFIGNCPDVEQSSYAIILTSSQDVSLTFSRPADFTEIRHKTIQTKYQQLADRYVSLDATMTTGLYIFYIMAPFYNIVLLNKWIFYSLTISNDCYESAQMTTYFRTSTSKQTRLVHFEFPQDRYYYAFQDYCLISVLQFYLEQFSLKCTAYIEFTMSPFARSFTFHRWNYFKVLANLLFI